MKKASVKIKEKPFLPILIFTSVFFIVAAYFLPIRFEENDDVVMLLLASGSITGTPEFFLVFINSIYGFLVSSLYKILPFVEWYTLLFSFIHILSMSIIITCIIKKQQNFFLKLAFITLFYIIQLYLIQNFQFTTTAALSSIAGLVLSYNSQNRVHFLGGIALFVIASLIRFEAAFLVLLIFLPIIFWDCISVRKIKFTSTCKYIGIAVFIAVLCKYADSYIVKQNPQMHEYVTYNKLRGNIHDNPNAGLIIDNLPMGINKNDYNLFLSFVIDPLIFDTNTLQDIQDKISSISINERLIHVKSFLQKYYIQLLMIGIISILIFYQSGLKYRKILITTIGLLFFTLCLVASNGTVKMRVFVSAILPLIYLFSSASLNISNSNKVYKLVIFFCLSLGLIIIFVGGIYTKIIILILVFFLLIFLFQKKRKLMVSKYFSFIIVPFLLLFSYNLYDRILWLKNTRKSANSSLLCNMKMISTYTKIYHKKVLPHPTDLVIENVNPFCASTQLNLLHTINTGWMTNYPIGYNRFQSFKELIETVSLFVSKENKDFVITSIQESIERHYSIHTNVKIIAENEDYVIVNFSRNQ
jgi:hypothetical protein